MDASALEGPFSLAELAVQGCPSKAEQRSNTFKSTVSYLQFLNGRFKDSILKYKTPEKMKFLHKFGETWTDMRLESLYTPLSVNINTFRCR